MEKKPKPKTPARKKVKEKNESIKQTPANNRAAEKSYYYDDAHGYEIYDPNEDEEKDEN